MNEIIKNAFEIIETVKNIEPQTHSKKKMGSTNLVVTKNKYNDFLAKIGNKCYTLKHVYLLNYNKNPLEHLDKIQDYTKNINNMLCELKTYA